MINNILKNPAAYAKAIGAFFIGAASFAAVMAAALADGHLSVSDVITIVASLGGWLGGTGTVYQVTNTPTEEK